MTYYGHKPKPEIDHAGEAMKSLRAATAGTPEVRKIASDVFKAVVEDAEKKALLKAEDHSVADHGLSITYAYPRPFAKYEISFNLKRGRFSVERYTGYFRETFEGDLTDDADLFALWTLATTDDNMAWLPPMMGHVIEDNFETLNDDERTQVRNAVGYLEDALTNTGAKIMGGAERDAYGWIVNVILPERDITMERPFQLHMTVFRGEHAAVIERGDKDEIVTYFTDYIFGLYGKRQERQKEKAEAWAEFKAYQDRVNPYKPTPTDPLKGVRKDTIGNIEAYVEELKATRERMVAITGADDDEEWDKGYATMRGHIVVNAGRDVDECGADGITSTGKQRALDYLDNVIKYYDQSNSILKSLGASMGALGISGVKWVDDAGNTTDEIKFDPREVALPKDLSQVYFAVGSSPSMTGGTGPDVWCVFCPKSYWESDQCIPDWHMDEKLIEAGYDTTNLEELAENNFLVLSKDHSGPGWTKDELTAHLTAAGFTHKQDILPPMVDDEDARENPPGPGER